MSEPNSSDSRPRDYAGLRSSEMVAPSSLRIAANAGLGFTASVVGVIDLISVLFVTTTRTVANDFLVLLAVVVFAVGAIGLVLWRGNERGFWAGVLLGVGFCLLCPIIAVLVICGNTRF